MCVYACVRDEQRGTTEVMLNNIRSYIDYNFSFKYFFFLFHVWEFIDLTSPSAPRSECLAISAFNWSTMKGLRKQSIFFAGVTLNYGTTVLVDVWKFSIM